MKPTKIQQTKTGKPTESPETKSKKQKKEKKTQFYRKVLSSKNSKQIWKVIHRILNPNMDTHADPSALKVFFNKTAERLVGQNATTDNDILSHIDCLQVAMTVLNYKK